MLAQPAASEILSRAIANDAAQNATRAHYIYREHAINMRPDRKVKFTNDYEWIFLEGRPYRRQVAHNGVNLKGKAASEEKHRFEITAAERRAEDATRKPDPHIFNGGLSHAMIGRALSPTLLHDEKIEGRTTWVLRCDPNPEFVATSAKGHEAKCYRYTLWIEQTDFAIVKERWEVIAEGSELLPGSVQTKTLTRIADGLWLPELIEGEYYSGPPRITGHWRQTHRFTDYRRFGSEATFVFVN